MTKGEIESAERRALNALDAWLEVTGLVEKHTGYYYELQGVIIDAVHCGAQGALGIHSDLPSRTSEKSEVARPFISGLYDSGMPKAGTNRTP